MAIVLKRLGTNTYPLASPVFESLLPGLSALAIVVNILYWSLYQWGLAKSSS